MLAFDVRKPVGWPRVWVALPVLTILYAVGILVFFEVTRRASGFAVDAPEYMVMSPFIGFVAACETVARGRRERSDA